MAGIYLHIPFCRQACHYCDFHFSTTLGDKSELLQAMLHEIDQRREYLKGEKIDTIYLGGGTPSLLEADELNRLFDHIYERNFVSNDAEITLEANPDDLTREKIRALGSTPVNRLSVGIQSFRDEDLKFMNRAHTAEQADYVVKACQDAGYENITVDLIYSIPGLSVDEWKNNLSKAVALGVQHISAYSLTIEPATVFGNYEKKGKLKAVSQELSREHFLILTETLAARGYEHYEVSNFCLPGKESKHNSSYWKGSNYLGIGPSAHSFNGTSRQWNAANNGVYIRSINSGEVKFEREDLDDRTRLNEYLMTGLRTKWGVDVEKIRLEFHFDIMKEYKDMIDEQIDAGNMKVELNNIRLTSAGFLIADRIASDLFVLE